MVTLDARNELSTANWKLIQEFLAKIVVPTYLSNIVGSYMQERTLWDDTGHGPKENVISADIPQGSV